MIVVTDQNVFLFSITCERCRITIVMIFIH